MKCPKCNFDIPVGAKFCNECGHKLEITCSECGQINPPGSKFCIECGHQLIPAPAPLPKELSNDEKIEKMLRPRINDPENPAIVYPAIPRPSYPAQ